MEENRKTRILVAVKLTQSSSGKGYPYASESSKAVFEWILTNIVRTNVTRFELQLLHVHSPHSPYTKDFEAVKMMEYFGSRCQRISVGFSSEIRLGDDPKIAICNEVKRVNPDLLVMGTTPTPFSFQRVFRRNVSVITEYCLKHAECHVTIVEARADDQS
ncbi:universal stress protein A-like protein [Mangifera indica]|uniref:universal stress protein A-like protein n=1 Tax=Mangifera indica TaxID=29780 RepID=UPI001CFA4202|nr:universal stress protein A-like protein [Mangifera indica]